MSAALPRSPATAFASARSRARLAGIVYSLVFLTGSLALVLGRGRAAVAAGLVAGGLYVVVTVLFYFLFKPVNKLVSLIAMFISLAGIVAGPLGLRTVNPLVFFGFYCLLIGYLILRSTFLPHFLGALMLFAGLGWLTFLSPQLGKALYPFNLGPGLIGEGALTVWLLVKGVDVDRWVEQADSGVAAAPTEAS